MDHVDTLVTDRGTLTFHFKLHTPQFSNKELPDPSYIFIDWMKSELSGNRLLQRHAGEVIARIRAKLDSDRTIIFQPANGQMGNAIAQERLEAYYRSCGFDYLPTSTSKFWMTYRPIGNWIFREIGSGRGFQRALHHHGPAQQQAGNRHRKED